MEMLLSFPPLWFVLVFVTGWLCGKAWHAVGRFFYVRRHRLDPIIFDDEI